MPIFSHGLAIHIAAPELRDRLLATLGKLAPNAEPPPAPFAVLADSTSALSDSDSNALPVIRLWTGGREPGGDNPFVDPRVRHVIGTTPEIDPQVVATTLASVARQTPIDRRTLLPAPTAEHGWRIETIDHATTLPAALQELLTKLGLRPALSNELATLTDELLQNALYDAPLHDGKAVYRGVSRTIPVPVVRPVDLAVAMDADVVCLSLTDRFGSVAPTDVVTGLRRCYAAGERQIEQKRGGAGLGLYMALAGSNRLVFNILPGQLTQVLLLRRHSLRQAALRASTPSLNICVAPAGAAASRA